MDLKRLRFQLLIGFSLCILTISACRPAPSPVPVATLPPTVAVPTFTAPPALTALPTTAVLPTAQLSPLPSVTATPLPTASASSSTADTPKPSQVVPSATKPAAAAGIPDFSHVIILIFENREYGAVVGNTRQMPVFNRLASQYTLLTQYFAINHPSLPNYIALIGGSTLGITTDCQTCYVKATNLPDLIEAAHRTWKTYQEDMPSPCFVGSGTTYAQRHNPFIYFDDIRTNPARCQADVLPLTQLDTVLADGSLPNYAFISPNLCNSAHDCGLNVADQWLGSMVTKLTSAKSFDARSLIIVTFDEGQGDHSCCGLDSSGGGQVATLLISPLVKSGFQDSTPYDHYSIIKTLAAAWGMPELGHAADPQTNLITAPWK